MLVSENFSLVEQYLARFVSSYVVHVCDFFFVVTPSILSGKNLEATTKQNVTLHEFY